jgi:hypothetical protein
MLGEVFDTLAEQRNLHLWRAGVRLMKPELLHYFLTLWLSNSHISAFLFSLFLLIECFFITLKYHCKASLRPGLPAAHATRADAQPLAGGKSVFELFFLLHRLDG